MEKQAQRTAVAGGENPALHGGASLPWSGLSVGEARDLAENPVDHSEAPALPRAAKTIKAGIEERERSLVDAGEAYPAINHELLSAYEARGRHLQAEVSGNILIALGEGIGKVVRWALLEPLRRWNERSRRLQELGKLDNRMLKDIGLTRPDIAYVARFGIHPGHRA